jgi:hypothetical protein
MPFFGLRSVLGPISRWHWRYPRVDPRDYVGDNLNKSGPQLLRFDCTYDCSRKSNSIGWIWTGQSHISAEFIRLCSIRVPRGDIS